MLLVRLSSWRMQYFLPFLNFHFKWPSQVGFPGLHILGRRTSTQDVHCGAHWELALGDVMGAGLAEREVGRPLTRNRAPRWFHWSSETRMVFTTCLKLRQVPLTLKIPLCFFPAPNSHQTLASMGRGCYFEQKSAQAWFTNWIAVCSVAPWRFTGTLKELLLQDSCFHIQLLFSFQNQGFSSQYEQKQVPCENQCRAENEGGSI